MSGEYLKLLAKRSIGYEAVEWYRNRGGVGIRPFRTALEIRSYPFAEQVVEFAVPGISRTSFRERADAMRLGLSTQKGDAITPYLLGGDIMSIIISCTALSYYLNENPIKAVGVGLAVKIGLNALTHLGIDIVARKISSSEPSTSNH